MNANADKCVNHEDELKALREALQTRLDQLLPAGEQQDLVYTAMREGTLVAGKRVRPLLLVLAARDLGSVSYTHLTLPTICSV